MNSTLYQKVYYTNKYVDFLINTYIREYDIRKAGPTALLIGGCINQNTYDYLCSLDRMERQIQTGLLLKHNPGFDDTRKSVITESRKLFIEANQLQDIDILSIKNDAIYVIGKVPTTTQFYNGRLEFIPKNVYTSYYRYNRTEMYYFNDYVTNIENIDIKNISDDKLVYHREYILDFLMYIFELAQKSDVKEIITNIQSMLHRYTSLELPLGYYREFNPRSAFKINLSEFTDYYADFLPENTDLHIIDISQNFDLLRYLYKIFARLYFGGK